MSGPRIVPGVDPTTAVGAAVDGRTDPVCVAVWFEVDGVPSYGTSLSPASARRLAMLLNAGAALAERPSPGA
ncbi:MAG: hypothetical protein ACRDQE_08910 [Gaiellales bacterium]